MSAKAIKKTKDSIEKIMESGKKMKLFIASMPHEDDEYVLAKDANQAKIKFIKAHPDEKEFIDEWSFDEVPYI